jgi:hypothetical protein
MKIYENCGPRDHWRQIQIAKTETLLGCFIYGLCVGLASEGLLWGMNLKKNSPQKHGTGDE